jgi:hypothetical protein
LVAHAGLLKIIVVMDTFIFVMPGRGATVWICGRRTKWDVFLAQVKSGHAKITNTTAAAAATLDRGLECALTRLLWKWRWTSLLKARSSKVTSAGAIFTKRIRVGSGT